MQRESLPAVPERPPPWGAPDPTVPLLSVQKETLPSTRLGTLPPAFSTRILPAQAIEYKFAFIQVPQDVSMQGQGSQGVGQGRGSP